MARNVFTLKVARRLRSKLREVHNALDNLVLATPTSETRNLLTIARMNVDMASSMLAEEQQAQKEGE